MFYEFDDEALSISVDEINKSIFTAGIINSRELAEGYKKFALSTQAVENIKGDLSVTSPAVEEYGQYRCANIFCEDYSFSLFVKSRLVIIVISSDVKNIVRDIFLKTVSKANCESIDENEFIEMLFVELICERRLLVNSIKTRLEETEERILIKNTQESFNRELFEIKKELLEIRSFFEGIIDICDYFGRYDSDAFSICTSKAQRLKESAELLYQTAVQLWDCCQANTDMKLNSSMKTLTLVTTIFFPVTIIVGWYGMNFSSMPEISWRYGYIYVIALTVFVIVLVMAVFKRRKWF